MPFSSRNPWDVFEDEFKGRASRTPGALFELLMGGPNEISGTPVDPRDFPENRAGAVPRGRLALGGLNRQIEQVNNQRLGRGNRGSNIWDQINQFVDRARKLGGAAGSGITGTMSEMGRPPSTAEILARLEELQDPSKYMMGGEDLEEQAMAAASAQYDPLISALRGQMSSASNRANQNKAALGQMFNSLSGSLKGDIPEIQQQYAGDKKAIAGQYGNLQKTIKDQYAATQAEQQKMLKDLNIEAAAAETLPQQQRDRDYFTDLAAVEGQTQQSALGQEERGAIDYTRSGSQIARTEGTQRQADLMMQLQELLNEYEGQIGAHSAAKQSAYTSNLGQLRSQMLEDAYSRADRSADNYLEMINLGRMLRKDEMEMGAAGQTIGPVKSPADVSKRALAMGLNPRTAQEIQDVFMSTIGNDPSILSGMNGITGQSLPKEALADRIVEAGRANGMGSSELNALMTIALEYFGRR